MAHGSPQFSKMQRKKNTLMSSPLGLLSCMCLSAGLSVGMSSAAQANPEDGVVASGAATIESLKTTRITQSTDRVVIDWRRF